MHIICPNFRCRSRDVLWQTQWECSFIVLNYRQRIYWHRNDQICSLVHYCVFLCTFKLIQHMVATQNEAKFPLWVQFIYSVSRENCTLLYFVNNFAKRWQICKYLSEKMACNFQHRICPQQSTFTDAGNQDTRDVKRGTKNRNSFQNRVLEIDFPKSYLDFTFFNFFSPIHAKAQTNKQIYAHRRDVRVPGSLV